MTAVITNVPGPQRPLYMAGSRWRQAMFWVPQSANIGIGVSILSFDGQLQFGLITDAAVVPDPQAIVDRFRSEFETYAHLTLVALSAPAEVADGSAEATVKAGEAVVEPEAPPVEPAEVAVAPAEVAVAPVEVGTVEGRSRQSSSGTRRRSNLPQGRSHRRRRPSNLP